MNTPRKTPTVFLPVALYVAAALRHEFIDRDGLLSRILPTRRHKGS